MNRSSRILTLAIAIIGLSATAFAQDRTPPAPTDVAARGIAAINDRATSAAARFARLAATGVERVNNAQADGNTDAARRAARSVIEAITNGARNAIEAIHLQADRTVAVLERLNAGDDLKRSVRTAARAAARQVGVARDSAVASVQAALAD